MTAGGIMLASSEERPGMLLKILQYIEQPPPPSNEQELSVLTCQSVLPRLKNPTLNSSPIKRSKMFRSITGEDKKSTGQMRGKIR